MALDTTYGNVTPEDAERLARASGLTYGDHEAGCTEPWITRLVCDLLVAQGGHTVLETGAFKGFTTQALVDTLGAMDGGTLHYCEIDETRRDDIWRRLRIPTQVTVRPHGDVFDFLKGCPDGSIDVCFLDDDHERRHVEREMELLYPKIRMGGLILLHDVTGSCSYIGATTRRYSGIALDLPRLGPAGGLGIVQVR